ncbi:Maf-like protein [Litorimonas cladophorae]|uniref:Nucleoside triphosphate pyrophosphatase n=1 Tax=Litorimonas cladophorae TaxID=1220491 RepID=A0A918KKV0_9PROT|nr:Maf family protein [Litorimonas cladophorae]GGX67258.1 Maf-like protein [Litorimonas cladophorae]
MSRLILASGSAIRREILDGAGLAYEVIVRPVDEAAIKEAMLADGARLRDIADALAEAKAMRVSRQEPGLVIGADQIMVMDDTLFDKPKDMAEARARLLSMRGKKHELIGAVVICENGAPVWRHICRTKLWVREFSEEFLDWYIETEGDALTKSVGAYRFEGPGSQLFEKVEGGFFAILGLDLLPVLDYLRTRGIART